MKTAKSYHLCRRETAHGHFQTPPFSFLWTFQKKPCMDNKLIISSQFITFISDTKTAGFLEYLKVHSTNSMSSSMVLGC